MSRSSTGRRSARWRWHGTWAGRCRHRWPAEIERITAERIYEPEVFFVRPIGFIEATAARRISYAESLVFEAAHEKAYREHGFEIVDVPPAGIEERAALVAALMAARPGRQRGRAS